MRDRLQRALRLHLVGPGLEDEAMADERLPTTPSRWYLNGFLVPFAAEGSSRADDSGGALLDATTR